LTALDLGVKAPSQPGTDGEPGTGYGLMLAKDYLTAMGGNLTVAPRDGGGLRISLSLPAA
jgi:signal transduction histidine kinase